MAKQITITPVGCCIRLKKKTYLPGETLTVDVAEAKRLVDQGHAAYVDTKKAAEEARAAAKAAEEAAAAKAELLAKISATTTREELEALLPAEEPEQEIMDAFETRMLELTEPDH